MSTNNKISNLISSQVPFFVRNDHENFVAFLEAYYEYLEQSGKTIDYIKNIHKQPDVDQTVDEFIDELYKTFLKLIPEEVQTDKRLLLKHVKDFYRARGTEKSISFLLRILFPNEIENVEFYYPKHDVLKISDGKWFIEKSIRLLDTVIDGNVVTDFTTIRDALTGQTIEGNTSGAVALVESVHFYYDHTAEVKELKLSNQTKDFQAGEFIYCTFTDDRGNTHNLTANLVTGIITGTEIINGGIRYKVGDQAIVTSNSGTGGIVEVASITQGNIKSIFVVYGGAGFQANTPLLFSGGGGSGANAYVLSVNDDGYYHPNTYSVYNSLILDEANTPINNSVYSNLNSIITDPANNWIQNVLSTMVYSNTGPIDAIVVVSGGSDYENPPTISVQANTRIRELGILGRMEIINGGKNYEVGDTLVFDGGLGTGAEGQVAEVDGNGSITRVEFVANTELGFPVGGLGYTQSALPDVIILSANGTNAAVNVTAILGYGEAFLIDSESVGRILAMRIVSPGSGYNEPPMIDLSHLGNGQAKVNASIVTGILSYPGRYINDDGLISAYNFIQDRDYYQTFSYVVRANKSIAKYRHYLKELIHPAGLKLWGEHIKIDEHIEPKLFHGVSEEVRTLMLANFSATANGNGTTLQITGPRDIEEGNVYLELVTGDFGNVANGILVAHRNGANDQTVFVYQPNNKSNSTGTLYIGAA